MLGKERIQYLDGLRGIAILCVVLYHAYARWGEMLSYGDTFKPFFQYGYIGVALFFVLSGYVISLSLSNSNSFFVFLKKRWIRLFPAMLLATIFIFCTAFIFYERPAGVPTFLNSIPGLLFIDDRIIQFLFNTRITSIEGAFWSLYVEFKFYIISGLIFFSLKDKKYFALFLSKPFIYFLMSHVLFADYVMSKIKTLSVLGSFRSFGWFVVGASMFEYQKTKSYFWLIYAISLLVLCSIFANNYNHIIPHFLFGLFFILSILSKKLQEIITSKILLFFGYISYALYLVHENMMVSMIIKLGKLELIPTFFLPIIPIIIVVLIASFITKYLEFPLRNKLRNTLKS